MTPLEAKQGLRALEDDPEHRAALVNKSHPLHAAAVAQRSALNVYAYPPSGGPEWADSGAVVPIRFGEED